jgi:hypothetical protein
MIKVLAFLDLSPVKLRNIVHFAVKSDKKKLYKKIFLMFRAIYEFGGMF